MAVYKVLVGVLLLVMAGVGWAAERKALLIGNATYDVRPLRNPGNDVDGMASKLTRLGFQVTALKNQRRAQMRKRIRQFAGSLGEGDEVVFYYSGHGAQVEGQNYLLPVQHDIQQEFEISDSGVSLNFVLGQLANSPAKYNVVILDACRDNPFQGEFKSSSRGLARLPKSVGSTLVAFAASPGGVSNDGQGQYGTYTKYLLQHLGTPGITLSQMFNRVRKAVYQASGKKQFPKEENGLFEDVYLVQGNAPPPSPPKPVVSSIEPEMVFIRGGSFTMGSPENEKDRGSDEKQHEVRVQDFYLAKKEVTIGAFWRFVNATGYKTDAEKEGSCYTLKNGNWGYHEGFYWKKPNIAQGTNDHPVVCVSWHDAVAYAKWLSEESGKKYRLPTEAEWEYATRAGGAARQARYWGDDPDQACDYANVHDKTSKTENKFSWTHHDCDDGERFTAPVGRYKPNGKGLYDMLGNVWEWTCSAYEEAYDGAELKCADKGDERYRVLRGGSWNDRPGYVRSAYRYGNVPTYRLNDVGFRLSRTP